MIFLRRAPTNVLKIAPSYPNPGVTGASLASIATVTHNKVEQGLMPSAVFLQFGSLISVGRKKIIAITDNLF